MSAIRSTFRFEVVDYIAGVAKVGASHRFYLSLKPCISGEQKEGQLDPE